MGPLARSIGSAILFHAFIIGTPIAAPHLGDDYALSQPDGSMAAVKVYGDEFFQQVETPDGFPLARDAEGWICYARIAEDGSNWVATDVRYVPGSAAPLPPPGSPSGASSTLTSEAIEKIARKMSAALRGDDAYDRPDRSLRSPPPPGTPPPPAAPDTVWGLTILVDFTDVKSAVSKTQIDDMLNKTGFTEFSNKGSVKDYYYEVSNQHLVYVNKVTSFVTMNGAKKAYDYAGANRQAIVKESLGKLKSSGFDFSKISRGSNGRMFCVNVLYAGQAAAGWSEGLWPHSGTLSSTYDCGNGIYASRYQMTDIKTSPAIGTFCHENGHMLMGWPDLYSYDKVTNGAGKYCIMSTSGGTNPCYPNPYFRFTEGWIDTVDITDAPDGSTFSVSTTADFAYAWSGAKTGSQNEMFLIETKKKTGRNSGLPDEGLCIWHVNVKGSNTYKSTSPYDLCNIEQADGQNHLENKGNSGDANDLWDASGKTQFNDNTSPNAKWHNGASSGIDLRNVSAKSNEMSFTIGEGVILPSIKVTEPNVAREVTQEETLLVKWQDNLSTDVAIDLLNGSSQVQTVISAGTQSDGSFSWVVPTSVPAGSGYKIRVSEVGNATLSDASDVGFTIVAQIPRLTVTKGSGDGLYTAGATVTVTADSAAIGWEFVAWTGGKGTLSDSLAPTTTLLMPSTNLTITATFREIPPDGIIMPPGRGNLIFIEKDTLFYDDGGKFRNYAKNFSGDVTFMPAVTGYVVTLEFLTFTIEDSSTYQNQLGVIWDTLIVYNGIDSTAPKTGHYWGPRGPSETLISSATDGSITVRFSSDEGKEELGWVAKVGVVDGETGVRPTGVASLPKRFMVSMNGNIVKYAIPQFGVNQPLDFALYALDGTRLWHATASSAQPGYFSMPIGCRSGSGVYVLNVRTNGFQQALRVTRKN